MVALRVFSCPLDWTGLVGVTIATCGRDNYGDVCTLGRVDMKDVARNTTRIFPRLDLFGEGWMKPVKKMRGCGGM